MVDEVDRMHEAALADGESVQRAGRELAVQPARAVRVAAPRRAARKRRVDDTASRTISGASASSRTDTLRRRAHACQGATMTTSGSP